MQITYGKLRSEKLLSQKIVPIPAPCLRVVPDFIWGETYFISFDGKTAQKCILFDWFDGIVLLKLNGQVISVNEYEFGYNKSHAILNTVIDSYEISNI